MLVKATYKHRCIISSFVCALALVFLTSCNTNLQPLLQINGDILVLTDVQCPELNFSDIVTLPIYKSTEIKYDAVKYCNDFGVHINELNYDKERNVYYSNDLRDNFSVEACFDYIGISASHSGMLEVENTNQNFIKTLMPKLPDKYELYYDRVSDTVVVNNEFADEVFEAFDTFVDKHFGSSYIPVYSEISNEKYAGTNTPESLISCDFNMIFADSEPKTEVDKLCLYSGFVPKVCIQFSTDLCGIIQSVIVKYYPGCGKPLCNVSVIPESYVKECFACGNVNYVNMIADEVCKGEPSLIYVSDENGISRPIFIKCADNNIYNLERCAWLDAISY